MKRLGKSMMGSSKSIGIDILQEFIASCLFIHDDVDPNLRNKKGEFLYDQFGSNPFFLGATSCVVDTMNGFGDRYLEYLDSINCLPKDIVVPDRRQDSLLANLLEDDMAIIRVREIINRKQLNLSGFYLDESKDFQKLIQLTSTTNHVPKLVPTQTSYNIANDKIVTWQLMDQNRVVKPDGSLCYSESDLVDYANFQLKKNNPILIKKHHWQNHFVNNVNTLSESLQNIQYPVIAERVYPTKISLVSHYIRINKDVYPLFILRQNIKNWKHYGNDLPARLPEKIVANIHQISKNVIDLIPAFEGVFAVDFIITEEEELLPVDLNPRFNTSTYPAFFLSRFNIPINEIFASMRFSYVPVPNLGSIITDKKYVPFSPDKREGILLMTPVYNFARGVINSFFYLIVAKTLDKLLEYEVILKDITNRCEINI